MSAVKKTLNDQRQLLTSAIVLETGKIANKQLTKLAAGRLPAPMNMLAGTPVGQLVLANTLKLAAEQFRPGDANIERLVNAMVVSAYSEVIGQFDFDGIIDDLLNNATVKKNLTKQAAAEATE